MINTNFATLIKNHGSLRSAFQHLINRAQEIHNNRVAALIEKQYARFRAAEQESLRNRYRAIIERLRKQLYHPTAGSAYLALKESGVFGKNPPATWSEFQEKAGERQAGMTEVLLKYISGRKKVDVSEMNALVAMFRHQELTSPQKSITRLESELARGEHGGSPIGDLFQGLWHMGRAMPLAANIALHRWKKGRPLTPDEYGRLNAITSGWKAPLLTAGVDPTIATVLGAVMDIFVPDGSNAILGAAIKFAKYGTSAGKIGLKGGIAWANSLIEARKVVADPALKEAQKVARLRAIFAEAVDRTPEIADMVSKLPKRAADMIKHIKNLPEGRLEKIVEVARKPAEKLEQVRMKMTAPEAGDIMSTSAMLRRKLQTHLGVARGEKGTIRFNPAEVHFEGLSPARGATIYFPGAEGKTVALKLENVPMTRPILSTKMELGKTGTEQMLFDQFAREVAVKQGGASRSLINILGEERKVTPFLYLPEALVKNDQKLEQLLQKMPDITRSTTSAMEAMRKRAMYFDQKILPYLYNKLKAGAKDAAAKGKEYPQLNELRAYLDSVRHTLREVATSPTLGFTNARLGNIPSHTRNLASDVGRMLEQMPEGKRLAVQREIKYPNPELQGELVRKVGKEVVQEPFEVEVSDPHSLLQRTFGWASQEMKTEAGRKSMLERMVEKGPTFREKQVESELAKLGLSSQEQVEKWHGKFGRTMLKLFLFLPDMSRYSKIMLSGERMIRDIFGSYIGMMEQFGLSPTRIVQHMMEALSNIYKKRPITDIPGFKGVAQFLTDTKIPIVESPKAAMDALIQEGGLGESVEALKKETWDGIFRILRNNKIFHYPYMGVDTLRKRLEHMSTLINYYFYLAGTRAMLERVAQEGTEAGRILARRVLAGERVNPLAFPDADRRLILKGIEGISQNPKLIPPAIRAMARMGFGPLFIGFPVLFPLTLAKQVVSGNVLPLLNIIRTTMAFKRASAPTTDRFNPANQLYPRDEYELMSEAGVQPFAPIYNKEGKMTGIYRYGTTLPDAPLTDALIDTALTGDLRNLAKPVRHYWQLYAQSPSYEYLKELSRAAYGLFPAIQTGEYAGLERTAYETLSRFIQKVGPPEAAWLIPRTEERKKLGRTKQFVDEVAALLGATTRQVELPGFKDAVERSLRFLSANIRDEVLAQKAVREQEERAGIAPPSPK